MDDSTDIGPVDRILDRLAAGDEDAACARLDDLRAASTDDRKAALRSLRSVADDRPAELGPLSPSVAAFLDDEVRSVRLSTAKLLVAIAAADPGAVRPVVPELADRLGDDAEFYYVRARTAEALGYVAVEYPEAVTDPEILAEFRVGLEFDEPETRQKLAKALEHVALGDPGRLRHRVDSLAEHLDDSEDLVRYRLATALVVIGTGHPGVLADAAGELRDRLGDDVPQVRGRAAAALGLLARSDEAVENAEALRADLDALADDEEPFVAERARFALDALDGDADEPDAVATTAVIREETDEVVADIQAPADDGQCPHCGLELPDGSPSMCPRCGGPY